MAQAEQPNAGGLGRNLKFELNDIDEPDGMLRPFGHRPEDIILLLIAGNDATKGCHRHK